MKHGKGKPRAGKGIMARIVLSEHTCFGPAEFFQSAVVVGCKHCAYSALVRLEEVAA